MRFTVIAALASTTAGYSLGAHPCAGAHPCTIAARRPQRTSIVLADEGKGLDLSGIPIRSVIIGLLTVQSVYGLVTNDLPSFNTDTPDLFATVLDGAFLGWGVTILLGQTGVLKSEDSAGSSALAGTTIGCNVNVGREPSTWMPNEWAASGARLSLPTEMTFLEEELDLGVPGEESLGGRYARKLSCEGGSFVGPKGIVDVKANGGGWIARPTNRRPGEYLLRFFVDFPEEAARNDVTLPAGRVFFSSACWDPTGLSEADAAALQAEIDAVDGRGDAGIIATPSGVQLLDAGGLTIKRNDWRNGWGAFGDVMLILGRYKLSNK